MLTARTETCCNSDISAKKTCTLHGLISQVTSSKTKMYLHLASTLEAKILFTLEEKILKEKIQKHLLESGDWVQTLKIAKAIVGPDATKKDVNRALYALEKQGLVERKDFGTYDWRWRLVSGETEDMLTKSPEVKMEVREEKVRVEGM